MKPRIVTYWPPMNGATFPPEPTQMEAIWEGTSLDDTDEVIVADDVEDDGYILEGTHDALDPGRLIGIRRIHSCSKIPDLRTLKTLRVAVLS